MQESVAKLSIQPKSLGPPQRNQPLWRACIGFEPRASRLQTFVRMWVHMSTVLIVDDDPLHLKLYAWVVERGGFRALAALVQGDVVEFPDNPRIDVAVLDYRLGNKLSAVDVAKRLKALYPSMPILILSDMLWMPDDVAPYASGFIRKGDPQQLIDTIGAAINQLREDDIQNDGRDVNLTSAV